MPMREDEQYQRGVCCHEAGHAVVLHSFGVPVEKLRVVYTKEKGWHGCTIAGSAGDVMHQAVILVAGKVAEEIFDCPAHENFLAWGPSANRHAFH
jgi:hypothetical protein